MTHLEEGTVLRETDFDEVTDISESCSEGLSGKGQNTRKDFILAKETTKWNSEDKIQELRGRTPKMSGGDSDPEQPVEENLLEEQDSPPQGNEGPSGEEVITLGDEGDEGDEDDEQDFPSHLHLTPGQGTEVKETDEDATSNGLASVNMLEEQEGEDALGDDSLSQGGPLGPMEGPRPLPRPPMQSPGTGEDDDDDDDDVQAPLPEGSYDPRDYENLDVPQELKELFTYISKYTPQNIELEYKLRPYIPDYIPAVGDIDAFVKIPRPDGETSFIGLTVLDEPSAKQSDSTVLDLHLRAVAKHTTARSIVVKTVENAEKNGKVIEKWMRDISELHRAKPPPTVHYSKRMSDIDSLMQEWPGELEDLLKEVNLPSAALQVELPHYVDIICSILDIPVYKSRIQSLHVLFTLFSVFKNSAHFRHLAEENNLDNENQSGGADRLVL